MIGILNRVKEKAEKDKDVIAVLLFGSYVSGKAHRDIDVCLFLGKKMPNLRMSRKKVCYQKMSSKLDVQVFQQLPLYIKMEVLRKNKPLLIKEYEKLFDCAVNAIKEFGFFEKYYEDYLEHVKNGAKKAAV